MLSTTIVHTCAHCGSERVCKHGCTGAGAQRARCRACGRTFMLAPQGPRYSEAFKAQVLAAHQDRMALSGIQRTFGVCYATVMRWLGEKNGGLARARGHAPAR